MAPGASSSPTLLLDRYRVYDEIASGGMATVHLGRLVGDAGFSRTVAVKRLHPHYAKDRDIVAMFTDEARIAARIRHPNVVPTLDVISRDGEVFLVMEYVHGEALSRLMVATSKRKEKIPPRIVAAILSSALHGLHSAHEAKNARGELLGVVHRDISPQNIIVGTDGIARVLDFGIARAAGRLYQTNDGAVKGKMAYMSPEQLLSKLVDRRSDIYSAGVVLWESLMCKRLFPGTGEALMSARLGDGQVERPSHHLPGLPTYFDKIILRALKAQPEERFSTALAMAHALEAPGQLASTSEVAAWIESIASESLAERARLVEQIENEEKRVSLTSLTDEIPTNPVPRAPHRVEATVKMSTSSLLAATAPARLVETNSNVDVMTTVPLRRDGQTLAGIADLPLREAPMAITRPRRQRNSGYPWWLWLSVCVAVFLISAVIVALLIRLY